MAQDWAKAFYNSKAWKRVSHYIRCKMLGRCERCGAPNSKQVHHKVWLTPENIGNPDIALGEDNLELLCDVCHAQEHNQKYSATIDGYVFCRQTGMLIKSTPP